MHFLEPITGSVWLRQRHPYEKLAYWGGLLVLCLVLPPPAAILVLATTSTAACTIAHVPLLTYCKILLLPTGFILAGNILQDIAYGPRNLGYSPDTSRQKARDALAALNLESIEDCSTHALSFGMRKLVAIAGVLAMHPDIMILDEPTSGIDPEGARDVLQALEQIRQRGTTIMISTHDMDLAYEWADEVLILCQGQALRQASAASVFNDLDLLQQARLRQPWQPAMAACLHQAGLLPDHICPRSREQLLQAAVAAHQPCSKEEDITHQQPISKTPYSPPA